MNKYVIGMDIGGTKSHLAIFDAMGNQVGFEKWGPLNHEVLPGSFNQFELEMRSFINGTLEKYHIQMEEVRYSVLGVAGVDVKAQHVTVTAILKRIGFVSFTLSNDSFLGIMAGLKKGVGICAINGTGSAIAGINEAGRLFQIGGQGDLSDDRGGGITMGKNVAKAVYRQLFCKGPKTILSDMVFKAYGIVDKHDYIEEVVRQENEGKHYPEQMNLFAFKAALEGDQVAAKLILDMASFYSHGIMGMIEELGFDFQKEVNIVLAGSVFVKGRNVLLLHTMKAEIAINYPDLRINYVMLENPPVCGAIVWALKEVHGNNHLYQKVMKQFKALEF